nr:MAG TPA: hypothetical protein [Caudoviricetes sp.]
MSIIALMRMRRASATIAFLYPSVLSITGFHLLQLHRKVGPHRHRRSPIFSINQPAPHEFWILKVDHKELRISQCAAGTWWKKAACDDLFSAFFTRCNYFILHIVVEIAVLICNFPSASLQFTNNSPCDHLHINGKWLFPCLVSSLYRFRKFNSINNQLCHGSPHDGLKIGVPLAFA